MKTIIKILNKRIILNEENNQNSMIDIFGCALINSDIYIVTNNFNKPSIISADLNNSLVNQPPIRAIRQRQWFINIQFWILQLLHLLAHLIGIPPVTESSPLKTSSQWIILNELEPIFKIHPCIRKSS